MKMLLSSVITWVVCIMPFASYGKDVTTIVAKAQISLSSTAICSEKQISQDGLRQTVDLQSETASVRKGILALENGKIFEVSFFGIFSRSYAAIVKAWQVGDSVEVEYVGGVTAYFHPYKIKNLSNDEEIWVKSLDQL